MAENLLWERLRRKQLNNWGFRRQAPLAEFVVDFLCHKPALVIEVDGPVHDNAEQQAFDAQRAAKLERAGYLVVRVKEKIVRDNIESVLAWIAQVGGLVMDNKVVPDTLKRMDTVPLP